MTRGTLRDRWRREVYKTSRVGDACKLLLIAMADDMRDDGYVTVPREELALRLGRADRRISERLAEAVDARLLDRVQRGQKGRTATYRALLPDTVRVTAVSTLNLPAGPLQGDGSEHPEHTANPHPEGPFRVTPGGPASSKHTGTAAGRAACEPSTSELRNDSNAANDGRHRAVGGGAA